ncbi:MAG: hypothetical protein IPH39_06890 [Sulfuritalea sp.]|jgi:predicted AAA+ superfamily ATPase|nr:hypothetical protein [Sulfuritalea sp.]
MINGHSHSAEISALRRFDLEDPRDEARLASPMLALEALDSLVIIDEVQRRPDLFPVLRVLADRAGRRMRYPELRICGHNRSAFASLLSCRKSV